MVIRGRTRGNGRQLSQYLLTMKDNDDIFILDIVGRGRLDEKLFHNTMLSMSLTSELTKSDKGLYHAQINPAYGEDQQMTPESWLQAADLLGKELGLQDQRRVVVIHTKKGRSHGHVVWERYDYDKGTMISDSFSRLAQDRARQEMEKIFEHQRTPVRNAKRPEMKQALSDLWQNVKTGAEFIKKTKTLGYVVAAGVQRRPFMVVDDTGRSFDLVRQLDGVKTQDVRERLQHEKLTKEKDAIELIRQKQKLTQKKEAESLPGKEKIASNKAEIAAQFAGSKNDIVVYAEKGFVERKASIANDFKESKDDVLNSETSKEITAKNFASNKQETLSKEETRISKRDAFLKNFNQSKSKNKAQGLDREPE